MKHIIGIMAATRTGVIGDNGKLPWNYPDEVAHFKQMTAQHMIVMGKKTYDAIPKDLLKDRHSLVLSRKGQSPLKHAVTLNSLNEFLHYVNRCCDHAQIFMIGGGEIADLFLKNNLISSFFLTQIHRSYAGDTYLNLSYFRTWFKEEWKKTEDYTIYLLKSPSLIIPNLTNRTEL